MLTLIIISLFASTFLLVGASLIDSAIKATHQYAILKKCVGSSVLHRQNHSDVSVDDGTTTAESADVIRLRPHLYARAHPSDVNADLPAAA